LRFQAVHLVELLTDAAPDEAAYNRADCCARGATVCVVAQREPN
jgi:hypothetical protein